MDVAEIFRQGAALSIFPIQFWPPGGAAIFKILPLGGDSSLLFFEFKSKIQLFLLRESRWMINELILQGYLKKKKNNEIS